MQANGFIYLLLIIITILGLILIVITGQVVIVNASYGCMRSGWYDGGECERSGVSYIVSFLVEISTIVRLMIHRSPQHKSNVHAFFSLLIYHVVI